MEKKNLILITIDCLRADRVGYLEQEHEHLTPTLNKLARSGISFTRAYSNGVGTTESFPSILTSTYALMNPNSGGINNEYWVKLSDKWPTIAEIIKKQGYETAAFNANPYITKIFQYNRGFDYFEDSTEEYGKKNIFKTIFNKINTIQGQKFMRANKINKKALNWVKTHPDCFFLWLHYMDVHATYNPKDLSYVNRIKALKLQNKIINNPNNVSKKEIQKLLFLYNREVKYVDQQIGIFLNEIQDIGISTDNTYFIVTSDHGEQFFEHGNWQHGALYDEVLHVPLIICGPNIESDTIIEDPVSHLDLCPTITDLLKIPKESSFLGQSLVSLYDGSKAYYKKYIISETLKRKYSCRIDNWKYITDSINRYELYNIKIDPKETINLINFHDDIVEELQSQISHHIVMENEFSRSHASDKTTKPDMDIIEERLKKLGYF